LASVLPTNPAKTRNNIEQIQNLNALQSSIDETTKNHQYFSPLLLPLPQR
jgi:hypothetical protein